MMKQPSSRLILWVAVVTFALHNLEESSADFVGWDKQHLKILESVSPAIADNYWIVITTLSVLAVCIATVIQHRPAVIRRTLRWFAPLMIGVSVWHIGVSLWAGSAQPGVWTALFLNMPVYTYLTYLVYSRRGPRP